MATQKRRSQVLNGAVVLSLADRCQRQREPGCAPGSRSAPHWVDQERNGSEAKILEKTKATQAVAGRICSIHNDLRNETKECGEDARMGPHDSFAELEARLKAGDQDAASEVFGRFAERLIALARAKLGARFARKEDPSDVVQSVYGSFFSRYRAGQFDLDNWDSLWSLLTVITVRKCLNRTEYYLAKCRSISEEADLSSWDLAAAGLSEAIDREPTPLEAAVLAETVEQVMRGLEQGDRAIIELSLQGYTPVEVSTQLGVSERKVVRMRARIKDRLRRMQADEVHAE
jgi:RNA polymerase sigma-70 factor (ECF subfamily)